MARQSNWDNRHRGNTTTRGYGTTHQHLRATWQPAVTAGTVTCWRCTKPIHPEQPWHLGHDDTDRTITHGPEHVHCNLTAAAQQANTRRPTRKRTTEPHPNPLGDQPHTHPHH